MQEKSENIFFLLIYFFLLLLCRWFCHFDDDNYVNVPRLVDKLSQFDHRKDWYLGKPSLPEPLEILDRDNNHQQVRNLQYIFLTVRSQGLFSALLVQPFFFQKVIENGMNGLLISAYSIRKPSISTHSKPHTMPCKWLLKCLVLQHSVIKTKHLRSLV